MGHIDKDQKRFRDIVNGRIKREFKRYIVKRELVIPKGNGKYALSMPRLDMPRFLYDPKQIGGVGQGEGEFGNEPGDKSAEHQKEVEVTLEELAKMFCESLQLPNLQNKGKQQIPCYSDKYKSISTAGPKSLVNFKRTYKEALKREITGGTYVPGQPISIRETDFRYKAPKTELKPSLNAGIIYKMDVSGSMSEEKKELVRTQAFWIDIFIRSQYERTENRYVIHDSAAKEVDQDTFYKTNTAGGTKLSSAIELADKIRKQILEKGIILEDTKEGTRWKKAA